VSDAFVQAINNLDQEAFQALTAGWTVVSGPPTGAGFLYSVTAVPGTTGAWAVGTTDETGLPIPGLPLIDSWNGTSWTKSTVPSISSYAILKSVDASSASDAWAVGYSTENLATDTPVVLHWNGTWSTSPSAASAVLGGRLQRPGKHDERLGKHHEPADRAGQPQAAGLTST
jgi:hypothetical protein